MVKGAGQAIPEKEKAPRGPQQDFKVLESTGTATAAAVAEVGRLERRKTQDSGLRDLLTAAQASARQLASLPQDLRVRSFTSRQKVGPPRLLFWNRRT